MHDEALLSWRRLNICLLKGSNECIPYFALLYCLPSSSAVPRNILITAMAMCLGWQMARASLLFLCCCTGQAGTPVRTPVEGTVTCV